MLTVLRKFKLWAAPGRDERVCRRTNTGKKNDIKKITYFFEVDEAARIPHPEQRALGGGGAGAYGGNGGGGATWL